MGISSFTCAKTNLPIIVTSDHEYSGKNMNDVVFLPSRNDPPMRGWLGQYATFHSGDMDIDLWDSGYARKILNAEAKFVLNAFYDANDTFDSLGRSELDPGQGGLLYGDGFISKAVEAGGFKTFLGLELAYSADLPIEIASRIDEQGAARLEALASLIASGYEESLLAQVPGNPECGVPGTIGKFAGVVVTPLDAECSKFACGPQGKRSRTTFEFADGRFNPNPKEYGRSLAPKRVFGEPRTATFEGDGVSYTVKDYGSLYTVEGDDYPLKAFKQVDHALNTIGFDLPFPAALEQVDLEAGRFFSPWEQDKPRAGTFSLPSAGSSLRP